MSHPQSRVDPDFAFEPVPGLPAHLPRGETLLWQGRPSTWRLAIEAMGLNWVIAYFALVVAWRGGVGAADAGLAGALAFGLPYVLLGAAAVAVILGIAWVQARAAVYSVTTARVVMRVGAVLPVTFNIPFARLGSAALDLHRGGTGTIALTPNDDTRLSYLVLWPHVRPWHMTATQPALRCIPDAARVAALLAEAAETRISTPVVARPNDLPAAAVAAE
ncbi:MAG TPA: photosynthetic complex putative assembly protein PuhB [Paracoccaceae bacterium]|nr:photosynthetic complex putative assembly protein PuhB [Paracoccaceae bacterium]HMO70419.1 photosynthetic complex putative assembly protein PuhB [Paracoccaceae bacterium]